MYKCVLFGVLATLAAETLLLKDINKSSLNPPLMSGFDWHLCQAKPTYKDSTERKNVPKMDSYIGSKHHPIIVICDAQGLKKFWEEIIETYTKQKEDEDSRLHQSALNKL
ncbi:hypothetical protein L345_05428, partial [Ophiophagus hannah]